MQHGSQAFTKPMYNHVVPVCPYSVSVTSGNSLCSLVGLFFTMLLDFVTQTLFPNTNLFMCELIYIVYAMYVTQESKTRSCSDGDGAWSFDGKLDVYLQAGMDWDVRGSSDSIVSDKGQEISRNKGEVTARRSAITMRKGGGQHDRVTQSRMSSKIHEIITIRSGL